MENFLNDVIKERSDFAELSTKALRAAILEELAYAKHVREHMPNGVSLKRHFNAQEDTLHGLISKVNHICRVVKDADVSVKFYQKIMGARLLNRPRFATNGFWLWLGNVQLHLIQSSLTVVPDHDDAPAGRVNHMSFDVFNIQDCEERLTEAGVKFSKVFVPTGSGGINQLFFQDPDAHWIELCDCAKFNDFVFGPFDEERAMEMARHYHEGMEPKGAFVGALFMNMLARDHDASDAAETDNLLKETFVTFSGGKDVIDKADLGLLLSKMGFPMSNEAEKRLIARVKRENPNDGDTLTYDDLVGLCAAELLAADDDELVEEVFKTIDTNSSGTISKAEFADCLDRLGLVAAHGKKIKRVDEIFAEYDRDGGVADGQLTLDEFKVVFEGFKKEMLGAHSRSMSQKWASGSDLLAALPTPAGGPIGTTPPPPAAT